MKKFLFGTAAEIVVTITVQQLVARAFRRLGI